MDKQFTASEVHERERFEEWYTTHACNYSRDPIGSRDCSLQWESWKAALTAHSAQAQPPAASVTEALLRDWFNLLCHAGIDAREEKANNALHRIMDIAKQVSSEIAKYENAALAAQESRNG